MQADIQAFFSAYERRLNDALKKPPVLDVKGVIASFASYFVGANPAGVGGGKNGWLFRFMIPRGYAFYRKIGITAMHITNIELTHLDDYHVMAKVRWEAQYTKKDTQKSGSVPFDNIYMLQVLKGKPKIFAYITADEQKKFNELGLL